MNLMNLMQQLSGGMNPMGGQCPGFGGQGSSGCGGLPVDNFLGSPAPSAPWGASPGYEGRPCSRRPVTVRAPGPRSQERRTPAQASPRPGRGEQGATRTQQGRPAGPVDGGALGRIDVERLVAVLPRNRRNSARQHFPIIIAEARRQGVSSRPQLAYMLATANHESGSGLRMEEIASGRAYEGRRGLGNTQRGDGMRFKGRGYVQITGRRNYTDWSRRLGVDLVNNPELAEQPDIAAQILVGGMRQGTFTGRRLDRYINGNRMDFDGARRTIGGGRGAERVSEVARRLLAAMR